jgi:hypothetical protein
MKRFPGLGSVNGQRGGANDEGNEGQFLGGWPSEIGIIENVILTRRKGVLLKEYEVMLENGERTCYLDTNLVTDHDQISTTRGSRHNQGHRGTARA